MTGNSAQQAPNLGAVKWWLIAVAALIAIMVLVGGATRLTESGLSIVEWKPVTGALPPLNDAQWAQAFEGYKAIPQYRELNAGMSLSEFKTIFWWEWSHRLLGRVIGAVYLLPFLFFLWRGVLGSELKRRLWLIFGLGALQGAVGWGMVASGLPRRVEEPWWRNLFANALPVGWGHRMTAYAVLTLAVLQAIDTVRSRAGAAVVVGAWWLVAGILLQATLGIFTLLRQVPIDLALTHQAVAIAVLTLAVFQAERLGARRAARGGESLVLPG